MGFINTIGYFKGTIIDGGMGKSSGELPQEVWALKATEVYDEEGQEYLPVDDEHDEIMAYLILMNHDRKENRNAQQIKKVTGWDGANYPELAKMDLTDVPLSFRVEENIYQGNTTFQVSWVAEPDAPPTRIVTKISKEDVQAFQAKYGDVLTSTKTPTKAVSAKGKGKTEAAAARTTKPPTGKKGNKPKVSRPTAPKTTVVVGKCSADDAYNACYELKRDDVTEDDLNDRWQKLVATYNVDETKITEEEWFKIKETLLAAVSKV